MQAPWQDLQLQAHSACSALHRLILGVDRLTNTIGCVDQHSAPPGGKLTVTWQCAGAACAWCWRCGRTSVKMSLQGQPGLLGAPAAGLAAGEMLCGHQQPQTVLQLGMGKGQQWLAGRALCSVLGGHAQC